MKHWNLNNAKFIKKIQVYSWFKSVFSWTYRQEYYASEGFETHVWIQGIWLQKKQKTKKNASPGLKEYAWS